MVPGLVQERHLEELPRRVQDNVRTSRTLQAAAGLTLVAVGTAMLVPGPLDATAFAVGFYFGGPIGGVIGVVVYNVIAVVFIVAGLALILTD